MSKGGLLCQRSRGWKGSTIHLATQTTAMVDTVLEWGSSMQMTITDSISATAVCFLSSIPMVIMRFYYSPALRPMSAITASILVCESILSIVCRSGHLTIKVCTSE